MYVRTRLTLWFALISAALIGTFGIVVFQFTRAGALSEIKQDIRTRASGVSRSLKIQSQEGGIARLSLDVFMAPDTYVQFVNREGEILERSSNLQDVRLPFRPDIFVSRKVVDGTVDGIPVFFSGAPVKIDGQLRGYAVVAQAPGPMYKVIDRLRGVLIPGGAIVLAITGVVVWLMVRRAMGPLVRLSSAATEIAARQDHEGRVGPTRRLDEIGQLASAIDKMLGALQESHSEVQAANEAQRKFLADVSHELRAPLTITLSSLELLQRVGDSDPEFRDRVVADMRAEVARMARMVTQLLMMARTGSGSADTNRPVIVADVLADVCRQWSLRSDALAFEWRIDSLGDAVVYGNEDYLHQLFSILLDNAFKFTPHSGRVEVGAEQLDGKAEIVVADTGGGIAASDLPRIFDRFYRGNGLSGQGSGLGLSIAQHIVEQYGGSIHVDSETGRGSRFVVRLPLVA